MINEGILIKNNRLLTLMFGWIAGFTVWHLPMNGFAQELRDVKPPVEYPRDLFWMGMLLISLLGVMLVIALFLLRKRGRPAPQVPIVVPPWDKAMESLKRLLNDNLLDQMRFNEFYSRLSDILRHYIEDRFCIKAPEMTTEEFLRFLKTSKALDPSRKEVLKEFLQSCDMVKFAKYAPQLSDAQKSYQLVVDFVVQTKKQEANESLEQS